MGLSHESLSMQSSLAFVSSVTLVDRSASVFVVRLLPSVSWTIRHTRPQSSPLLSFTTSLVSPAPLSSTAAQPPFCPLSTCHNANARTNLENKRRTLRLLVTAQLEVLAALQTQLRLGLALCALESQHDLLRCLGFLVEHGFRLTSVTGLFAVVSAFTLGE